MLRQGVAAALRPCPCGRAGRILGCKESTHRGDDMITTAGPLRRGMTRGMARGMTRVASRGLAGAALAAATLAALPAASNEVRTAGDLAGYCSGDVATEEGAIGRVFCFGYLTGVMQLHREMVSDLDIEPGACPDYAVSRERLAAVYVAFVDAHPDRRGEPPLSVLGDAAAAEWPCR